MLESTGMDIFSALIRDLTFILLSLICSAGLFMLYNRFPPAWFMSKGDPVRPSLLRKFPDGALFVSSIVILSFIFFTKDGYSLLLICEFLTMIFLVMISASDMKTGIIPDQFTAGLLFSSLFWMAYDIFLVQSADKLWYQILTTRIAAGLAGGAVLLVIGITGKLILKKDSVGMGDVKLMFACGLIADLKGIPAVFILSFLLALIPALIGIFSKRKAFDRLPFAPFISASVLIFLIFPDEIAMVSSYYGGLM